jgi:hypothetical protein
MRIHLCRSLSVTALALCTATGISGAQAKGHDTGKEAQKDTRKHTQRANGDVGRPAIASGTTVIQQVPPGLGRKGGMPPGLVKKGGLPPGQVKKYYRATDGVVVLREVFGRHGYTIVRTQTDGSSQYVYYRYGDGLVQRAVIAPGAERLSFQNVPQPMLQEVLARLY